VNVNELASAAPESLEKLAGMSQLNGIPVEVAAVPAAERTPLVASTP